MLDLNGHTVTGAATAPRCSWRNAKRVTVRNGSLVGASARAVTTTNSYSTRLEDLHVVVMGDRPTIESVAGAT